jgi:nicotinate-nucleotide pyrophosphorylase (carboxylating)
MVMDWQEFDWLLDAALAEDACTQDVTTLATVPPERKATGELQARQEGVVCGLPLAERLIERFAAGIAFEHRIEDGDEVQPGDVVAAVTGPAGAMLTVERTMLNFLQRLSGIATMTARYVKAVRGTGAAILDTRKTTPGWRKLEKYAVRCGGGSNHRRDLAEMALIKDNHLALLARRPRDAAAVREAVQRVREAYPDVPVEVEVEDTAQLEAAVEAKADIILLDNMTPEQFAASARLVAERCDGGRRPLLEASGGITLENVAAYARAGADRISVGALTHSVPAFDYSLEVASYE